MQPTEAIRLLTLPEPYAHTPQQWADLGAGSGTFTTALSHHLAAGSTIVALDTDAASLARIPKKINEVSIHTVTTNVDTDEFPFAELDGILMANSLHYIRDQAAFVKKLARHLTPQGRILLVEYDSEQRNRWVPYPVSFRSLSALFQPIGFTRITKLQTYQSLYGSTMYSALISR